MNETEEKLKEREDLIKRVRWNPFVRYSEAYPQMVQDYYRAVGDEVMGFIETGDSVNVEDYSGPIDFGIPISDDNLERAGRILEAGLYADLEHAENNKRYVVKDLDYAKDNKIGFTAFFAEKVSSYFDKKIPLEDSIAKEIIDRGYKIGNFRTPERLDGFDIEDLLGKFEFDKIRKEIWEKPGIYLCEGYVEGGVPILAMTFVCVDPGHEYDVHATGYWDNSEDIRKFESKKFYSLAENLGLLKRMHPTIPVYLDRLPDKRAGASVELSHTLLIENNPSSKFIDKFLEYHPEFK